ncbi:hypothetical protein [Streptomyces sp. H27-H5]|uniref:hypothetical protein n=1 Tax=Streptomyces sp. H27-H5 TaxID=2996460 RepID=UPI002270959A|nr:hypothetical protein [Streptomyces sp. H27-H5]MCY0957681.1 hypothetical protein [Streptomyces sp. H27-H5]
MTDHETALLDRLTEALLTTWHERVEQNINTDPAGHCAALAAAVLGLLPPTPPRADDRFPSYTGEETPCPKCAHDTAITRYRRRGEHSTQDRQTFMPSVKGERLERQCWRCDYCWDEAVAPPTGPAPHDVTPDTLARLLEASHAGWALDLSPACAEHMAGALLAVLNIRHRHDAPPADDHLEDAKTTDHPTPRILHEGTPQ